jgi:hypothetical protein
MQTHWTTENYDDRMSLQFYIFKMPAALAEIPLY